MVKRDIPIKWGERQIGWGTVDEDVKQIKLHILDDEVIDMIENDRIKGYSIQEYSNDGVIQELEMVPDEVEKGESE